MKKKQQSPVGTRPVASAKSAQTQAANVYRKLADAHASACKPVAPAQEKDAMPPQTAEFYRIYDRFVEECGEAGYWKESTYQKFARQRALLQTYRSDLTFDHFTTDGLNHYIHFLCTERAMCNSTIKRQLQFLKWFLHWAFQKNYHNNRDFDGYRPKLFTAEKKVIYLNAEQINKICNAHIPSNQQHLQAVRDVFLFCCFTGLRYSDAYNLKRSHVKAAAIEITTIKTSRRIVIDLNATSRAILDKYARRQFKHDKALPVISHRRMNKYLKDLGALSGLDEMVSLTYFRGNVRTDEEVPLYALLSTHAGRRSFICNALTLGIAPEVVMKWTGHSSYAAMKPYIDICDSVKKQAMTRFDTLLSAENLVAENK